ncbi:25S rRNA (uracil2634-N3)-methyltransferase [Aspergillus mulundensis]|uniref:25S rRNA (uridine-N(3))-methyltransferase BMT5-like domain-containing protein n=1 Tax=Aspergillus mulundensis TaxID=1810919 RepID=A0A3D8QJL9_9EURO|nr:Uncharacterized protein DSM5745_10583 [Aspergillus mulundensis]RDW61911.1 Uncharacterized protein DSM5745_10583 [Aspergillus mulundensis]
MSSFAKLSTKNNYSSNANKENKENNAPARKHENPQQKQNRRPIVPFRRKDRILLIGEGDFSFAHSLATHHRCRNLVATCYDSKEALYAKYPQAEKNIAEIIDSSKTKMNAKSKSSDDATEPKSPTSPKVLFSVDAKKLGSVPGGGKDIRVGFPKKERKRPVWKKDEGNKRSTRSAKASGDKANHKDQDSDKDKRKDGPWDMICFNFPHVGGISTDVNRQVRANQELLVAFFKACMPLLAGRPKELNEDESDEEWGSETVDEDESDEDDGNNDEKGTVKAGTERRTEPGQIVVTLFEGEPYTLWNIRDLARHAGLRVVTSFRFPWACYRGYSHARTLGEIEGKDGGRGGWRGEDREARMYVFEAKKDDNPPGTSGKRRKRSAATDDSDSD